MASQTIHGGNKVIRRENHRCRANWPDENAVKEFVALLGSPWLRCDGSAAALCQRSPNVARSRIRPNMRKFGATVEPGTTRSLGCRRPEEYDEIEYGGLLSWCFEVV